MRSNIAGEYGLALFKLAKEISAQKEIFDDFTAVKEALDANPELIRLLSNPRLSGSERAQVLDGVFGGKINLYLLNMLKILAEKRYLSAVSACWLEYRNLYCKESNILPVKVTSAAPLSEGQKERIINNLAKKTGSKILLSCVVDTDCLGGFVLEYGGKRYDATVKNQLSSFKQSIIKDY